jgi:hypothetical protein
METALAFLFGPGGGGGGGAAIGTICGGLCTPGLFGNVLAGNGALIGGGGGGNGSSSGASNVQYEVGVGGTGAILISYTAAAATNNAGRFGPGYGRNPTRRRGYGR